MEQKGKKYYFLHTTKIDMYSFLRYPAKIDTFPDLLTYITILLSLFLPHL